MPSNRSLSAVIFHKRWDRDVKKSFMALGNNVSHFCRIYWAYFFLRSNVLWILMYWKCHISETCASNTERSTSCCLTREETLGKYSENLGYKAVNTETGIHFHPQFCAHWIKVNCFFIYIWSVFSWKLIFLKILEPHQIAPPKTSSKNLVE